MTAGSRIVKTMIEAGKQSQNEKADIIIGSVISISPLRIKVDKLELTQAFLILGALCIETSLWRGLIVGDTVQMLRLASGQKYYVLQRTEGII